MVDVTPRKNFDLAQGVVRSTFKSVCEIIQSQGEQIRELQLALESKSSRDTAKQDEHENKFKQACSYSLFAKGLQAFHQILDLTKHLPSPHKILCMSGG